MIWRSGRRKEIFRNQDEQVLVRGLAGWREESRILVPLTEIRQTKRGCRLGSVMNLAPDVLSLEVPMGHLNLSDISVMSSRLYILLKKAFPIPVLLENHYIFFSNTFSFYV